MSLNSNKNIRSFSASKKVQEILADQTNKSAFINACIEYVYDSDTDIIPWIDSIEKHSDRNRYGQDFKQIKDNYGLNLLDRSKIKY